MNLQHQFTIHIKNITFHHIQGKDLHHVDIIQQHNFQCQKSKEQHTTLVAILYHVVPHTETPYDYKTIAPATCSKQCFI